MGLLSELDSIKYSSVLDLIKNDEIYDKKRNVLTAEEVFKLCQERYQLVENILLPLKKKLGENIEIIDIGFVNGMQDDTSIFVRYNKDNKQNYFTISNFEFDDINIYSTDDKLEKYGFVIANKKIILDIFRRIYTESLDSEISIKSTSNKFIVKDNFSVFSIKDFNEKLFCIEGAHSQYANEGLLYNKDRVSSAYPKLKELLTDENILNIYHHAHVYEEDTKVLKKTN